MCLTVFSIPAAIIIIAVRNPIAHGLAVDKDLRQFTVVAHRDIERAADHGLLAKRVRFVSPSFLVSQITRLINVEVDTPLLTTGKHLEDRTVVCLHNRKGAGITLPAGVELGSGPRIVQLGLDSSCAPTASVTVDLVLARVHPEYLGVSVFLERERERERIA